MLLLLNILRMINYILGHLVIRPSYVQAVSVISAPRKEISFPKYGLQYSVCNNYVLL